MKRFKGYMLIPNTRAGRSGVRGSGPARISQGKHTSPRRAPVPRRQHAPSQQTIGPGLPGCRALWLNSHLRIICGDKPCWLPAQGGTQLARLGQWSPKQPPLPSWLLPCSIHFPHSVYFYPLLHHHHPLLQRGKLRHRDEGTGPKPGSH